MNKKQIYLQTPQIPKRWPGRLDFWQTPSLFLWSSGRKSYTCTASVLCKTVHSPQGPDAYHSLQLLVFRPASSKWPATSDFMKSFWFRPDSNSLIKVPLIPLNLANSYEYFFSTLRPVLSPGPQTTVSLCLNGASNKYLNSCSEYRISPCEPWPFGKTLDQCSVTVTRLHSLQIWKG